MTPSPSAQPTLADRLEKAVEVWLKAHDFASQHRHEPFATERNRDEEDAFDKLGNLFIRSSSEILDALRQAGGDGTRSPTQAMLNAARNWSYLKYGKSIGNDAAIGCWQAMFDAIAPPRDPSRSTDVGEEGKAS